MWTVADETFAEIIIISSITFSQQNSINHKPMGLAILAIVVVIGCLPVLQYIPMPPILNWVRLIFRQQCSKFS